MTDYRMTSNDRTDQVSWLQELAVNISENLGEGSAEDLVEYALGEGREPWGIELPEWFDDYDYCRLVEMVNKAL